MLYPPEYYVDGFRAYPGMFSDAQRNRIELPEFRRYTQPTLTFGEIFNRLFQYLILFVVSILILWVLTWKYFMKYDVR
jgi:hypothetical protein